jgi:molybdate transport repressor ModE-like protein
MIRIDIRPVWRFRGKTEKDFDFTLIALLEAIERTGKLTQSAVLAGISYRHAWNLIEQWQAFFGSSLVSMRKGRGTSLTQLGADLLWAGLRARERLAPELENLASEFARTLNASLPDATTSLAVHASHDFAVGRLPMLAGETGVGLDIQYKGSFDALGALRRGECDLAGFHVPEGELGGLMARRYRECLPPEGYRFIRLATRTQGFIVRPGNPRDFGSVSDLTRPGMRMINRQRGSGTRALLEFLLSREGIDRARIRGYETEEITHAAVAVLVAGNQADVGFGLEAAAAQYHLDFVAFCRESYGLACRAETLETPPGRALIEVLKGAGFQELIASLPGYCAPEPGEVVESPEELARFAVDSPAG